MTLYELHSVLLQAALQGRIEPLANVNPFFTQYELEQEVGEEIISQFEVISYNPAPAPTPTHAPTHTHTHTHTHRLGGHCDQWSFQS